ncbi:MAG: hypothetical protein K1X92_03835 [Bacteroidia bacterium]|nr:hypothetical protein [Bacteroidia bacterium]
MKLIIQKNEPISTIQEAFHQYFHYLKIEMYSRSHEIHDLSSNKQQLAHNTLFSAIATLKKEGEFEFSEDTPTGNFEMKLWEEFGIGVQVFRRSGHLWIQTASTDDWSLMKQNEESRIMNQTETKAEVPDYTDTKDQED